MWMMGYNDEGSSDFNLSNSCSGRKLRPLVPRPTTSISTNNNATSSTHPPPPPPCLTRLHATDVFSLNHHHISNVVVGEQGGKTREFNNQSSSSVVVSSRWNPTPEQLQTLEDLYRRGTRTPSAEQIQHITSQLRRYGKIEGKNVFYWFQNHKARERQKRRRQLTDQSLDIIEQGLETKESAGGSSRTVVFEVEQTKNWPPPTNCSTLPKESVVSIQKAVAGGGGAVTECRTDNNIDDGWVQFDKGELQQHSSSSSSRRRHLEKNATWQMMQLSCPLPSCSTTHHLINSTTTTSCTAAATETAAIRSRMDPTTTTADQDDLNNNTTTTTTTTTSIGESSHQTLQLFPLESLNDTKTGSRGGGDQTNMSYSNFTSNIDDPPYQYFEFLPLKN